MGAFVPTEMADLTGFEPATSGLTGRRALQTAPQVPAEPRQRRPEIAWSTVRSALNHSTPLSVSWKLVDQGHRPVKPNGGEAGRPGGYLWSRHFPEAQLPERRVPATGEEVATRSYSPVRPGMDYVAASDARSLPPLPSEVLDDHAIFPPARFSGTLAGSDGIWRAVGTGMVVGGLVQILLDVTVVVLLSLSGLSVVKDAEMVWVLLIAIGVFKLYVEPGMQVRRYPGSLRARRVARATFVFMVPIVLSGLLTVGAIASRSPVMVLVGSAFGAMALMASVGTYLLYRSDAERGMA